MTDEKLKLEWYVAKKGSECVWIGVTGGTAFVAYKEHLAAALAHLQTTPERYYYVPNLNNRVRISFAD